MTTATLTRMDLDAAALVAAAESAAWDADRKIAEEAAEVFGYSALAATITRIDTKRTVLDVFKRLGIVPFDLASVTAYKAEAKKALSAARPASSRFQGSARFMWSGAVG